MGRDREHHAHVEGLALILVGVHHRGQCAGADRVLWAAILHFRNIRLHRFPDFIGNRDAIAVQIHGKGRDDMGFGAISDGRGKRLACQHMRPVQLPADHAIQQNLPVRLRFQGDEQAFVFKIPVLIGDSQRRHIRQFDKPELQLIFLKRKHFSRGGRADQAAACKHQGQQGRHCLLHLFNPFPFPEWQNRKAAR